MNEETNEGIGKKTTRMTRINEEAAENPQTSKKINRIMIELLNDSKQCLIELMNDLVA